MAVEALLQEIHQAGPAWAERAGQAEDDGSLASETASEVRAMAAHRTIQPTDFGGQQDSIETHMRVVSAVGEYCVAAAWCTAVWSAHNWMVSLFPDQGQKEAWDNPDALISASIVPKARFEVDGDDVMVSGRFSFASGCDHADWLGVGGLAQLDDDREGPVICLFPAHEAVIDHASWQVVGLAGTGSKDLVIDTPLRIPSHRVLFTPDAMTRRAPGQLADDRTLYRAPFRATAAIVLAAPVVGAAKAALQRFQERLDGHVIMAKQSSQRDDPAALLRLAESAAETNAAELVLLEAARRLDRLATEEHPDPVEVASIGRDTSYGVRLCASAVDRLYEASGGSALQASEPIQRLWRDVHAARSHAILTWDAAAMAYGQARLAS